MAIDAAAQAAQAAAPPLPALPAWYDPSRFERDPSTGEQDDQGRAGPSTSAASAREGVAALRRAAPGGSLAEVGAALEAHLARLQAGIAEAVNADYGEFVALPGKLAGLDAAAGRMRAPLERAASAARQAQRDVKGELAALRGALVRRQAAAEARATLELMQEAAAAAQKLEALIAEADGMMAAAEGAHEEEEGRRQREGQQRGGGGGEATAAAVTASAATAAAAAEQLAARGRLLERAAGESGRLAFLSARGEGLAFLRALAPRAAAARAALDSHLRAALADALTARDWTCATHCLRACVELGDGAAAEAALRSALAGPVIRARLERAAAAAAAAAVSSISSSTAASQQPLLADALSGLLQAVVDAGAGEGVGEGAGAGTGAAAGAASASSAQEAGALVLLDPSAGFTPAVDLPGAVVLAELNDQLGTLLPASFGFASLAAFRANHAAATVLLRELERACPSEAALARLRGAPARSAFLRRWNLPVYFSLQYQAVAGGLEEACSSPVLVRAGGGGGGGAAGEQQQQQQQQHGALAPTAALARGLDRCFSPDVYVPQLGDRFFRLACQLAARYSTWVADVGAASAKGGPLQQQQVGGSTALGPDGTPLPGGGGGDGSAADPPPPAPKALAWAAAASPADLALVSADADAAAAMLRGPARAAAIAALRSSDGDGEGDPEALASARRAEAAAGAALEASAARVEASARAVLRALSAGAVARCAAALQQVKGVTATYRMTSKGPPTRHSHYAATVLAPLSELLQQQGQAAGGGGGGGGVAASLSPASRSALASGAVAEVAARFREVAEEVLSAVRKTETSLQRLKKNRAAAVAAAGGGGGAGGAGDAAQQQSLSDSDKIALQLLLDALEFGRRAAALGVVLDESGRAAADGAAGEAAGAFAALVAAVRPPAGVPLPEGAASGLAAFGLSAEAGQVEAAAGHRAAVEY